MKAKFGIMILTLGLAGRVLGQGNSWVDGSGKWETATNWSQGSAPYVTDPADLITNAGNNTVTIDATTTNFPSTMTISNLILSAPLGFTNTLLLDNAGSNMPLQVLFGLSLNTNGTVVVNNSRLVATNGNLLVGNAGKNASLVITNGGTVLATNVTISSLASASNNSITVVGGTLQVNNGTITVGQNGSGSLTITGTGQVQSVYGRIAANNCTALVAGSGSVWKVISNLTVAAQFDSCLIITNGGMVFANTSELGSGLQYSREVGMAIVSGVGSIWSNSAGLTVGNHSDVGNQLTISDGGQVFSIGGTVGYNVDSRSNVVRITGVGSVWHNGGGVTVGTDPGASFNQLAIDNGGQMFSRGGTIGSGYGSRNSAFVGSGSTWNASNGTLQVGINAGENNLTVSNGSLVSGSTILGDNSTSNTVNVQAGGTWTLGGAGITIGDDGGGNSLNIDGGVVTNAGGVLLGNKSTSIANLLVITNGGALCINSQLTVGNGISPSNRVTVAAGGKLDSAAGVIGSSDSRAKGNAVIVSDDNSIWNVGTLTIGEMGPDNYLLVTNHGTARVTGRLNVGAAPFTPGSRIRLADGGMLMVKDQLYVANTNNVEASVQIAGGMTTLSSNLIAGSYLNSTGTVEVTDGGSLIATNGVIGIGNAGTITSGSGVGQMTVSNGTLLASSILLGSSAGGQGELSIQSGGVVSFENCTGPDCSLIANDLFLDGGLLSMTNATVYCGRGHSGAMIMSNGTAYCQSVFAGYDTLGTVTILSGSMAIPTILTVGHLGSPTISTGSVWISGGELVATNPGVITYIGNGGVGQLTLSNGTLRASSLRVANGSNPGTLTIAGGTLITDYLALPKTNSYCAFLNGQLIVGQIITNANGRTFTVGGGSGPALLTLGSGFHVFSNGLTIAGNATLTSCGGTISGSVLNNGLVLADGGGTLSFTGVVTNNGTLRAVNGATLEFYGEVVNNGLVDVINGNVNFHSTIINNGVMLDATGDWDGDGMSNLQESLAGTDPTNNASVLRITFVGREGDDVRVTWSMGSGKTNALQVTAGVGGGYTNDFADLFIVTNTVGSVTNYLDVGGATNVPARYYRVRVVP